MPTIDPKEVIVEADRFRPIDEDFLTTELMPSMKETGLINAIIIDQNKKLLAGNHRLEAAKRLAWSFIEYKEWETLDALTKKVIEFEENDKRRNFTWQERASAIAEIHSLKRAATPGGAWTASDTARALGLSVGKVSEDLGLASALGNERIAGRPTRRGALNTLKRERELDIVRELARRRASGIGLPIGLVSTSFTTGVVYNADCREVLKDIKDDSVDLIVMDPPWGIDFDQASQWTKKWIATYDDSGSAVRAMLKDVAPHLHRVLKAGGHLYTFFPIQEHQWWHELFTEVGFSMRQRPLIWFKSGQPSISDVYTSFLPCYEAIIWGYKGGPDNQRRLFARPIPEAQGYPRQPGLWHENEKPVEMLDRWIETSSEVNEVVLDPFGGGGSTAASAFGLGRYFITIEMEPTNYQKLCQRIKVLEDRKEEATSQEAEDA